MSRPTPVTRVRLAHTVMLRAQGWGAIFGATLRGLQGVSDERGATFTTKHEGQTMKHNARRTGHKQHKAQWTKHKAQSITQKAQHTEHKHTARDQR